MKSDIRHHKYCKQQKNLSARPMQPLQFVAIASMNNNRQSKKKSKPNKKLSCCCDSRSYCV